MTGLEFGTNYEIIFFLHQSFIFFPDTQTSQACFLSNWHDRQVSNIFHSRITWRFCVFFYLYFIINYTVICMCVNILTLNLCLTWLSMPCKGQPRTFDLLQHVSTTSDTPDLGCVATWSRHFVLWASVELLQGYIALVLFHLRGSPENLSVLQCFTAQFADKTLHNEIPSTTSAAN